MQQKRVAGVLGPTNTGKTHYAVERMLAHRTGVIGLPLRLLAREVYDKIVSIRGPSVVALLTGEERIVPPRVQYWVCTVESMPQGIGTDFVAIDEIQLCTDPERGHVFTDRLMGMRGLQETLFLGSDTMRGPISTLVPEASFLKRERMSTLTYSGTKTVSRMPARSAVVGFSVESVYSMAELIKRQKGGAAVVLGALSPRTRNAQVALYQNGDVDYLVATDAIGMGLNLDVNHVAFSALSKFDGRSMRLLAPNELAQIAGRAGRGMQNGSFGVTGEANDLNESTVKAIIDHRFTPIKKLQWRNSELSFVSLDALIASLSMPAEQQVFVKAREADDLIALKSLAENIEIYTKMTDIASRKLLWDICRIPDFRGISPAEHAHLLTLIFNHVHEKGDIPETWIARQVNQIDRIDGDIDTLSKRLAFIRTWTYISQSTNWLEDKNHWRERTRSVEDRLSDALHQALTQRFVDRRTSLLMRRLKQREALLAEVSDNGEVTIEGEFVGRLDGFRFIQDGGATGKEAVILKTASAQALVPHLTLRAERFYNASDTEIDFTDQGGLMWGDQAVGKMIAGEGLLKPRIVIFADETIDIDFKLKIERRLQHFVDRKIGALFEPLILMEKDSNLTGIARGLGFQLIQAMGILPRKEVIEDVKALNQDARGLLRKHGVRFGQFTIFMPLLLKPAPTRLRVLLWSLAQKLEEFPSSPPPGLVTIPCDPHAPAGYYTLAGYHKCNSRAIRIDMLERLADLIRAEDTRSGFEATAEMLSITGTTLEQFSNLMQGLGYSVVSGERQKRGPLKQSTDKVEKEVKTEIVGSIDEKDPPGQAKKKPDLTVSNVPDTHGITDLELNSLAQEDASATEIEQETYYIFKWSPQRISNKANAKTQKDIRGSQKKSKKRISKLNQDRFKTKVNKSKPVNKKGIDLDNPFAAALMGLKVKD